MNFVESNRNLFVQFMGGGGGGGGRGEGGACIRVQISLHFCLSVFGLCEHKHMPFTYM